MERIRMQMVLGHYRMQRCRVGVVRNLMWDLVELQAARCVLVFLVCRLLQRDFRVRKKEKTSAMETIGDLQSKFEDCLLWESLPVVGPTVDLDLIERSAPNKYVQELQEKVRVSIKCTLQTTKKQILTGSLLKVLSHCWERPSKVRNSLLEPISNVWLWYHLAAAPVQRIQAIGTCSA
eukprot:4421668-Amphidinium_carterae.1